MPAGRPVAALSEQRAAVIDRALERLRHDGLSSAGEGPAATRVLSVATRPFSYVARVESGSSNAKRRVIVKIPRLKPGKADSRVPRLKLEIAAAQALRFTLRGEAALSVPEVVAFYPEIPALVWSEVGGETLDAVVNRMARGVPGPAAMARLEEAFRGAGRWLRALQNGSAVEERTHSLSEMIAYVDLRLQRISELGPRGLDARWRDGVRRVFAEARLTPADCRLTAVHGDYSLSNIMLDGDRVVAIDFSRFGVGSIYYDLARIYHQLGLLRHKPWFLPSTVARLRHALVEGYEPGFRTDRTPFRLFLIQHLLCHWLGLLKTSSRAGWHVRAFNRWVGYRHRRELERLVEQLQQDSRRGGD